MAKCCRLLIAVVRNVSLPAAKLFENHDEVDPNLPTVSRTSAQIATKIENETGWDRLKQMFEEDETGGLSPELESVASAGLAGLFVGATIGGLGASKRAHEEFIEKNKGSQFKSHFDAKAKLQNHVTKAMGIGAFRLGWRLGLFAGAFMFFTTVVSTYRNKSSVFEFAAGGLLGGAMYKLPMGPKAMISGGVAGSVLGGMAGIISVTAMKLTGTTTEDLRYWRRGWKEASTREITSLSNPRRADALGDLGIIHELDLQQRRQNENNETSTKQ